MVLTSFGVDGIGADVEDENLAVVETARPEIFAIVGESHVMRFSAPADGNRVNHLAISRGAGNDVDRHQLVGSIADAFLAERPDMEILLLTFDQPGHEGRVAGFVRDCGR